MCARSVGGDATGILSGGSLADREEERHRRDFRCSGGDVLCGRLVWFRLKPGDSNLDLSNSDPKLRNRPLCGLVFMTGFKPADPNNWEDGRVYNTDDGNTYHATMRLQPDGTLRLHGYIVVTLIGASEIWTRHTGPVPACPGR